MHFVLARAYRRAGRTADAEKAQQEFLRLDRIVPRGPNRQRVDRRHSARRAPGQP